MEKDNQRTRLTKRLLQEALLHLLQAKSLDKISVSELCRQAGINRSTFYRHYTLPCDVLADIERGIVENLKDSFSRPNSAAELARCLKDICAYLYEHADLIRVLIRCNTDAGFAEVMHELYEKIPDLHHTFANLHTLDDESLKLSATYLGGGGYLLLRQWLIEDIQKSPDEIAAILTRLICRETISDLSP